MGDRVERLTFDGRGADELGVIATSLVEQSLATSGEPDVQVNRARLGGGPRAGRQSYT
jgi:hypothetical protein